MAASCEESDVAHVCVRLGVRVRAATHVRAACGGDQISDVRCQISDQMSDISWLCGMMRHHAYLSDSPKNKTRPARLARHIYTATCRRRRWCHRDHIAPD